MAELPSSAEPFWKDFRRRMPVSQRWAYLDHAAVAPLTADAQAAMTAFAQQAAEQGATDWAAWYRRCEEVRQLAACLIGAEAAEVALVPNTTAGINLVAEGMPWQPGDNVVTLADEFPSNLYPWLNLASRGVETRRVSTDEGRLDLNRLDEACDRRTRLVSVSWVSYSSGFRHDIEQITQIAQRHGARMFLDAIQGLGVFPLDVSQTPIDFLAADGHKWLLGPEGAGVMFVRRERLEELRPLQVGWHSVVHAFDFRRIELALKPAAARYEGGSQNMIGFHGLGASLELLLGYGTAALSRRILEITDLACQRLTELGARICSAREGPNRSGIVSFELPGCEPQQVRAAAKAQGVALGCRAGRLRISLHAYNDDQDIDRLVACLKQ